MEQPVNREYRLSGNLAPADWAATERVLGRLGLSLSPLLADESTQPAPDAAEPTTLPYRLDQINSPGQYLAHEHVEEFWPVYRQQCAERGETAVAKHETLSRAFTALTNPVRRNSQYDVMPRDYRIEQAARLGLRLVIPRRLVGFPVELLPGYATESIFTRQPTPGVLEVGSFISYMQQASRQPTTERPMFLNRPQVILPRALSNAPRGPDRCS